MAIAFAVVLILLSFAVPWPEAWIVGAMLALACGILAASVVLIVLQRHRSRYSLDGLRELHLSGGPPPIDIPDVEEDAGVLCPCCGSIYGAWMKVCPHCGR
jgi:predicted outer membrane lipoprotein